MTSGPFNEKEMTSTIVGRSCATDLSGAALQFLRHSKNVVYRLPPSLTPTNTPLGAYEFTQLDHTAVRFFFDRPDVDPWRLKTYLRSLDDGCYGFIAHKDSDWSAVQWVAPPGSRYPKHLPEKIVRDKYWCFNEHTHATHRRRGLWTALKSVAICLIREKYRGEALPLYSDTATTNVASRRAYEQYGFTPHGVVKTISLRIPKLVTIKRGTWEHLAPGTGPGENRIQS